jgi:protein SCO1
MFERSAAWRRAAILAGLLAGATGCSAGDAADGGAGDRAAGAPEAADRMVGLELVRPIEMPAFTLSDTDGRPYDFLSETSGSLSFLFFGFTHCPDICPVQLANLAAALGDLPYAERRKVEVVFVTIDPERDTPEVVREWLDRFDREFVGLVGSPEEVGAVLTSLDLPLPEREEIPGTDQYVMGHPAQVMAITGDGRIRFFYPGGVRQADWRHDLPRLLELNASLRGGS